MVFFQKKSLVFLGTPLGRGVCFLQIFSASTGFQRQQRGVLKAGPVTKVLAVIEYFRFNLQNP